MSPLLVSPPIAVSSILSKIRELQKQRSLAVLMTEQNFQQAVKIADRGYVLVQSKIHFEGRADDLGQHELLRKYYLGA